MAAPTPTFFEYKHRVVFSLLRAAVRVALRLDVSMNALVGLLEMAVFREAREHRGLELADIASRLGKSLRTVSSLHHRFRSDFFAPEEEVALRREIAASLNERPAAPTDLAGRFPTVEPERLAVAIRDLVREGCILDDSGTLRRNPEVHSFYDERDVAARVDGLNRQMDVLAETVWTRWVEPQPGAVARTFVFNASDADFETIVTEVVARMRERAIAADGAGRTETTKRRGMTVAATSMEEPS